VGFASSNDQPAPRLLSISLLTSVPSYLDYQGVVATLSLPHSRTEVLQSKVPRKSSEYLFGEVRLAFRKILVLNLN
jgi:hypothetical protein